MPPEKTVPKRNSSNKLNTVISFPHYIPGLSYPLVNSDKCIYSIVPTDSKIVKKIDYPKILSLKLVEAKLDKDPILKTTNVPGKRTQRTQGGISVYLQT